MSKMKRCKQCGMLKEESAFRPYSYSIKKDTKGRYSKCRKCESINAAYRRLKQSLEKIQSSTSEEAIKQRGNYENEIRLIEEMYKVLSDRGLSVPDTTSKPTTQTHESIASAAQELLDFYSEPPSASKVPTVLDDALPDDLREFLEADINVWIQAELEPEYLQETVYESLKAKYRPQIGVDQETFLPIYDDTYKEALNQILRKFDDYEEYYSNREVEE